MRRKCKWSRRMQRKGGEGGVGGREGTRYSKEVTQHDSDITEVQ